MKTTVTLAKAGKIHLVYDEDYSSPLGKGILAECNQVIKPHNATIYQGRLDEVSCHGCKKYVPSYQKYFDKRGHF